MSSKEPSGKVLRVDLTTQNSTTENVDETTYRRYLGGRGLGAYFLLKELKRGIDPLGPSNKLIFATSVITGAPLPGLSRHTVAAKSPLTDTFAEAEAGGYWGPELKFAGFDAVIVEGTASTPVYLWIHDGEADLKSAEHIWGKSTSETQETIRSELGDSLVRIASIGVAGENKVRFACIANELRYMNGRGGLGAVMGSKLLKAIAVRGRSRITVADQQAIRSIASWFGENWRNTNAMNLHSFGTAGSILPLNRDGTLPTCNFRDGSFEEAENISAQAIHDAMKIEHEGCFACSVRCKQVLERKETASTPHKYDCPEYESIASLGSLCGIGDLDTVIKANHLCNTFTLDTMSTGCVISFAMECYENGILTAEDSGGIELNFGNSEALLKLVEMIARRQGIGDTLAEGSKRAAEKIGGGSEKYAMTVKGKEIPLHEPRGKASLALAYALSPIGADHNQAPHDPIYAGPNERIRPHGLLEPVDRLSLKPEKVRVFSYLQIWQSLLNCLDMCIFTVAPVGYSTYEAQHIGEIVAAVTGWNVSMWELMKVGERALNMLRCFNLREGFSKNDDWLPKRFFEPLGAGPRKGARISEEDLRKAIDTYYGMMGWEKETGRPRKEKLEELDIGWVNEMI